MGFFSKVTAKLGGGKVGPAGKSGIEFDSGSSEDTSKAGGDDDFLAEYNAQMAGEGEGDDPMAFYGDNARNEAMGAWGTRPAPSYSSAKESEASASEADDSDDDASGMDIDDLENYGAAADDSGSEVDDDDVSEFDEMAGPPPSSDGGGENAWDEKPPIDWNSEDEESDAESEAAQSEAEQSDNEDANESDGDAESEVEESSASLNDSFGSFGGSDAGAEESDADVSDNDDVSEFDEMAGPGGAGENAWDEKPPIDWNSEDEASDAESESAAESEAEQSDADDEESDAEESGSLNDSFGSFGGSDAGSASGAEESEAEQEEENSMGGSVFGFSESEGDFDDAATEDADESAFDFDPPPSEDDDSGTESQNDDEFFNEYGNALPKELDEDDPMQFYESSRTVIDNRDDASVGTDDEATMAKILEGSNNSLAFESFQGSVIDSDASDNEDDVNEDDDVGFGFVNQSPAAMMQADNPNFGVDADDRSVMTNSTDGILFGNLEGVNDAQAESFFAKHGSPDMDERGISRGMEAYGVSPIEADEDDAPMRWRRRTQMMNYNDLSARKHPFRDLLGPTEAVSLVSVVLQSTYTNKLDMGSNQWNNNVSTSSLGSSSSYVVGKTRRILLLTTAPNARLLVIEPYSNTMVDQVALDDPRKIRIIVISKNEFSMRCIRESGGEVEWRFTDLLVPANLWVNVCGQCGLTAEDIIEQGYANCLGATNSPQRIAMFGKLSKRTVTGKNQRWRKRFVLLVGKQLAWFKNDDDWRPRGLLILDESVSASTAQDSKRKNCFDLETDALPNGVRIHVSGQDRCDEWLTSIQSLLDHSKAKASGTPVTISRASEGPMYCLMVSLEPKMEQVRTTTNALSMRLN